MTKIDNLPNIRPELLDLPDEAKLAPAGDLSHPPRILMLYGSLRERSFSRFLTWEAARILEHFGAEVKIFDPMELPMVGSVLRPTASASRVQVWPCLRSRCPAGPAS
jgi:arsenic resistance protein ArsH